MVALLPGLTISARAQSAEATRVTVQPRFDVTALYKPSAGFGVGGGVDVRNLGWPGSHLALDAYVAQHAGAYDGAFFSRDLLQEGVALGVSAGYETYGRLAHYGLSPATTKNNKLQVESDHTFLAGHAGVRRGMLGLMATTRYQSGAVHSYRDDIDNAFSRLDSASTQRLRRDVGERVAGLSLGAVAYLDRRDAPVLTRDGMLLTAGVEGFHDLGPAGYDYVQGHVSAMVFVSSGAATFVARALALHTEPLGDPLPLVLLPRLSHRLAVGPGSGRFTGNDLLLFDLQVYHPVPNLYPDVTTDGFLVVGAFNAYDNLFTDARLVPSWTEKFEPARRYPLRAAVGAGIRAYQTSRPTTVLSGAVGLSADGFVVSTLSFTLAPTRLRAPWRW